WIRGDSGSERFKMRFEDASSRFCEMEISRYSRGGIGNIWQRIKVPVKDIDQKAVNSDALKRLIFMKSDQQTGAGTLFIDQIMFANEPPLLTLEDNSGSIIKRLFLSCNSFVIYGDQTEKVIFNFVLSRSAKIRIRVYDITGRIIRTLLSGESYLTSGSHVVKWDGKNDVGKPVQRGIYLFQLYAEDVQGKSEKKMNVLEGR
ncbi:MAG: hypothetical protein KKH98_04315, partial [Spirochaetes bacterium]|nr:hypothetical protein [Spirochaetota bacterium]